MSEINWNLSLEEASAILSLLGDLPTKTGAFPLLVKLKEQTNDQVTAEQP